ncbi:MAG TPA: ABC transporter ATP-binding protein/permease [Candidatus Borkfalkia excrementigallinarum]|uniref:ABC transporter ATP-binding protein/permease n=1 Tax=Candidatus Borkfalkia excrementigallinarum TaxID=2838506 RepID=A0A9D1ZWT4_9FIRM|nr:ABC transporter ATP-binding protein/permease [Candidatus Borkfalkia excrementigallinarum]
MKLLLHFMKPYWKLSVITIIVVLLDSVAAMFIPTITARIVTIGTSGGTLDEMITMGIIMLVVAALSGFGALLGSWLCAKLSAKIGRDIRNAVYDKSLELSAADFEKFGTGSMITRTSNDIAIIQAAVVFCIQMIIPVPVMCILGIVLSFDIDRNMGFLILGVTLLVILAAIIIIKKASSIFARQQKLLDRMNVVLRENITGVRVIRAFNKEKHEEGRMKKSFLDYAQSAINVNRLFAILDSWVLLAINLGIILITWLGGNTVGTGAMEIADISQLVQFSVLILSYIMMAQIVIMMLPRARVCLHRINEVMQTTPEIQDGSGNAVFESSKKPAASEVMRFEHVGFRFADADEETLRDISFSCRKGETTAIIGGTGSGKSTIAKLMLRFHDVTSGAVYLQGSDIRNLTQNDLRSHISYVPQKAWLFSGTIRSNLLYGNENATEEELQKALRIAQSDFVNGLSAGMDSPVAQGGTNFSGGQKQRLSIARALVKKADLYIFDDSFSALDFKTDAALRRALAYETQYSAVLIIAQRISTILHADQIIVLDNGKIAGIGKHDELMESCAVYRDIAQSQMKGA